MTEVLVETAGVRACEDITCHGVWLACLASG